MRVTIDIKDIPGLDDVGRQLLKRLHKRVAELEADKAALIETVTECMAQLNTIADIYED